MHQQSMSHLRVVALCFFTVLFASCGGGGGDGGQPAPQPAPPPGDLTGTWFGTLEDTVGAMGTTSVTITGTSITEIRVNNSVTGQTGTITQRSAQVFAFTLNDGTKGGLFLDSVAAHAVFVDDKFNFAVVQKGATPPPPTYANADLNGSWSGIVVTTTDFNNFSTAPSSATCTHPTCSTGGETVTLGAVNTLGRYLGTSAPSGAFVAAILSPDKQFGGTYACDAPFPAGCEFTAWRKQ